MTFFFYHVLQNISLKLTILMSGIRVIIIIINNFLYGHF